MAKITILGLENFEHINDRSLFSSLVFPDGINKDDAVNNILLRCGEFETLYSDPDFLRDAIGLWGRKWYRTFEKWDAALKIDYNPLENYNRTETWSDTNRGTHNNDVTGSTTNSNTHIIDDTVESTVSGNTSLTTSGTDNNTTTESVSAFDSNDLQTNKQTASNGGNSQTSTGTSGGTNKVETDNTTTDNGTGSSHTVVTESNNNEFTHVGNISGNIGVTTSQMMLESELSIAKWNILNHIADLFADEFTLMIY